MDLHNLGLKCWLFCLLITGFTQAQISPEAGSDDEVIIRDLQLLGEISEKYSFTVRPVIRLSQDSLEKKLNWFLQEPNYKTISKNRFFSLKLLPLATAMQWNSRSPYGRNNSSFLRSKGYQMIFNAGFEFNSKLLDLRFYPDIAYLGKDTTSTVFNVFGRRSMVRLKAGKIMALTVGTENLWWGPAVFNSLMMSNNAPGFPHVSLNTLRPLKTPIGTFEFQLIGADLRNGSRFPMENFSLGKIDQVLPGYLSNERFLNGLNISFQPAFMPGFSAGFNRMIQYYTRDRDLQGNFIQTYLPVIAPAFKNKNGGVLEDARFRDQLINFFARYLFKQYHFEIYGEFGWNDSKFNIRDLVLNPDHAAAYNLGFRKVVRKNPTSFFTIEAELTQMAPTNSEIARPAGNWYEHSPIREGYTNYGQIMGGGVSLGDNTTTIRFSKTSSTMRQSVILERYQHNPQFKSVKWTDWILAVRHQQQLTYFTIAAGLDIVNRKNYNHSDKNEWNFQPTVKIIYNWR